MVGFTCYIFHSKDTDAEHVPSFQEKIDTNF